MVLSRAPRAGRRRTRRRRPSSRAHPGALCLPCAALLCRPSRLAHGGDAVIHELLSSRDAWSYRTRTGASRQLWPRRELRLCPSRGASGAPCGAAPSVCRRTTSPERHDAAHVSGAALYAARILLTTARQ